MTKRYVRAGSERCFGARGSGGADGEGRSSYGSQRVEQPDECGPEHLASLGALRLLSRQPTLHLRVGEGLIRGKSTTDHSDIFQVDLSTLTADESGVNKAVVSSIGKDNDTKSTKTRTESIGSEDHLGRYCMRLPCSTIMPNRTPNTRRRKPAVAFSKGLMITFGGFDGEEFYSELHSVFLKEPATIVLGAEKIRKDLESIGELFQDPQQSGKMANRWFDAGFCVQGRWIGCHWYSLSLCFKTDECPFLCSLRMARFQVIWGLDFQAVYGFLEALLTKQVLKNKRKFAVIAEYFEIEWEDLLEECSREDLKARMSDIKGPESIRVQVGEQEAPLCVDIQFIKAHSRFFEQLDSWRQSYKGSREAPILVPSGFLDYLMRTYRRDGASLGLQSALTTFELCDYLLDRHTKQVTSD